MGDITTHLKTFARRPSTETETVNLRTVVTNALSLFQDRIAKEGIAVELKFPRRDLLATGEDIRMEQVVINLLANALDAMAESDVKELRIVGRRRGERAMMDIVDTGVRDRQGGSGPDLRPVLHDQGAGKGPRPRPVDQSQDRPRFRWHHSCKKQRRKGSGVSRSRSRP